MTTNSAHTDSDATRSCSQPGGYVIYDDCFRKLIGPSPTLRRLVASPQGLPLYHEAGVHLRQSNVVYVSSNRIPSKMGRQRIAITAIPLDAIPAPRPSRSGVLASLEEEDPAGHHRLAKEIRTMNNLPSGLSMPNGATPWTIDGKEAVLWCEQGHDDLDDHQPTHSVPAALVAMLPNPFTLEPRATRTLVDNYQGRPFSSLNDVVVHQQSGIVFFTDPDYGVGQSFKSMRENYAPNALYAWDPKSNQVKLIDDRYDKPNGVTFIPDPSSPNSGRGFLATTDTGRFYMSPNDAMGDFHIDESKPACIYLYPIEPHHNPPKSKRGTTCLPLHIGQRRLLANSDNPIPDGLHPDCKGNLWVGNGDGLHIFHPSTHTLIGKIIIPNGRGVANFCWAGKVTIVDEDSGEEDDEPHQDGQEFMMQRQRERERKVEMRKLHRILIFCEDELWEACVSVDGFD